MKEDEDRGEIYIIAAYGNKRPQSCIIDNILNSSGLPTEPELEITDYFLPDSRRSSNGNYEKIYLSYTQLTSMLPNLYALSLVRAYLDKMQNKLDSGADKVDISKKVLRACREKRRHLNVLNTMMSSVIFTQLMKDAEDVED